MSPNEIEEIIQSTIKGELQHYWIYLLISVIVALISAFAVNYIKTKSINFATKQDIEQLTRKVEVIKAGQQLRYRKINQFYDKTIQLKSLLITMKNEQNQDDFSKLFEQTKDLLTSINSDVIFSFNLKEESSAIEEDYNQWITEIKQAQKSAHKTFSINFDETFKTIDLIQSKILND